MRGETIVQCEDCGKTINVDHDERCRCESAQKSVNRFIDNLEDFLCWKYDIDDFELFMKLLVREISGRYCE